MSFEGSTVFDLSSAEACAASERAAIMANAMRLRWSRNMTGTFILEPHKGSVKRGLEELEVGPLQPNSSVVLCFYSPPNSPCSLRHPGAGRLPFRRHLC